MRNQKMWWTAAGATILSALLVSCASNQKETKEKSQPENVQKEIQTKDDFIAPEGRSVRNGAEVLAAYRQLSSIMQAAKEGRSEEVFAFLRNNRHSAMGESVLNEYLKTLGKRGNRLDFQVAFNQLPEKGRTQESKCYADWFGITQNTIDTTALIRETGKLSEGCNVLLQNHAARGILPAEDGWRRVRGLISGNYLTDARALAQALGSSLDGGVGRGAQENLLRQVISPDAVKSGQAARRLENLSSQLTAQQQGFAWGVLALSQAKQQKFTTAIEYYRRADLKQLNREQIEWYARSLLRVQNWHELGKVIQAMPIQWQNDPTWQYWLARSLAAQGKNAQAKQHYQKAAQSGRNFYALLATEELGQRVNTQNNVAKASNQQIATLAKDGALQQSLSLFQSSLAHGDWNMRRQAQAEWRYAIRDMNERTMLAAAHLAYQNQFYEMAVNTAERTDHLLDYQMRYISPFREWVEPYSAQAGIDIAWVYGLIRQESRFITGAKSSVGASGLMQVMPATAREIAQKIGIPASDLHTLQGNIRMGTWYLGDAKRRLQNNEVMATAGYNAGPGRARNWQASVPLEGAIYAETIPFNETRDYVKKVMANAVYYASVLNLPQTSLKQRMGTVPAR